MRFKEVKKLINEQEAAEQLFEVNMSPSNLAKLANQIDARAGMEFEMIVPDAEGGEDSGDMEPDYEQDESVSDIDDACRFFYDGDYNSRREIDRLRESMDEDYSTWVYEQTDKDWHDGSGFEFFQEYLDREDPYDRDEGLADAEDYVRENNPDLEPGSDEYSEAVTERLNEQEANYITEQWEEQGRNYDYAREEFDDEKRDDYSESDWLDNEGLHAMTDVSNQYDVQWPYYTSGSNGGRSVEDIADSFSRAIGRPVNSSTSYHGARREEGHYVVEPDGSLEGDDPGDAGLEFVSPPLPLSELLSDLEKVKKWAKSEGAYTGADFGTGLHINVSVPGLGAGQENLDYVKLALLLGDEHVLSEFERMGNTYCKSGLGIVKRNIKDNPEQAKVLLDQMKSGLEQMASRAVHGAITNKFTSINTKDGYVEFRSPGGDWLNEKFDKIEPTLLRFVVALDAAVKPDLYRQEYLKKLYKALEPAGNKNTIEFFTKYVAGELPKAALKSFVRQAQLERNIEKGKQTGKMWWRVGLKDNPTYGIEVVGSTRAEAIQAAKEANTDLLRLNAATDFTAKPIRPYEEKPEAQQPAQQQEGNWGIWITSSNRFVRAPGQIDNSVLRRFPSREAAEQFLAQTRAERPDMRNDIEVREIEPTAQEPQGVDSRVPYELYNRTTGEVIQTYQFSNDEMAMNALDGYREGPGSSNPEAYGIRRGPGVSNAQTTTNNLRPTGPGPWELASVNNNQVYFNPEHTNRNAAETEARTWIQRMGLDPAEFVVRTREGVPQAPIPGSTLDLQRQRAAQQGQQVFTGEWKVVDDSGQELHRFGGIGNVQSDANRVAAQWIQRNPTVVYSGGISVLPVMGPAQ